MAEPVPQRTSVPIPLAPGAWAVLTAAWPMTPGDWERMMGLLEAMKAGLIEPPAPPSSVGAGVAGR